MLSIRDKKIGPPYENSHKSSRRLGRDSELIYLLLRVYENLALQAVVQHKFTLITLIPLFKALKLGLHRAAFTR